MIEQKLERLQGEIKSLKSAMPIAGSLLDTYFYTSVFTHDYNDGDLSKYTAVFTPTMPEYGLGVLSLYVYCESLSTDPRWSPYNPVFLSISEGYQVNNSGQAIRHDSFRATGFGTYTVKVTVSVYSTVPGTLSIEWQ